MQFSNWYFIHSVCLFLHHDTFFSLSMQKIYEKIQGRKIKLILALKIEIKSSKSSLNILFRVHFTLFVCRITNLIYSDGGWEQGKSLVSLRKSSCVSCGLRKWIFKRFFCCFLNLNFFLLLVGEVRRSWPTEKLIHKFIQLKI